MRALAALLLLCPVAAWSAVWTVDHAGSGDFLTIQAAVNAASSGDVIHVLPGTYVESVDFLGRDVVVVSTAGAAATEITPPGGSGSAALFRNGESVAAVLDGFTLRNGDGTDHLGLKRGGAAYCLGASPTIRNCVLRDCNAPYAGALYVRAGASPYVVDCEFLDNSSASYGGAVGGGDGNPIFERCLFEGNAAVGEGTVFITSTLGVPVQARFVGCTFRGNTAKQGAGIDCPNWGANHFISGCIFENNTSLTYHGGAVRVHEASPTIRGCLFIDNYATEDGGAILALDGGVTTVADCTFWRNSSGRNGGAVAAWYSSTIVLQNCIVAGTQGRPALFASQGTMSVVCSAFHDNELGSFSGGVPNVIGVSGNFAANPQFCDPDGGDFHLSTSSPCAPANSTVCGLIGALDVGCGPVSVETASWGSIKSLYR